MNESVMLPSEQLSNAGDGLVRIFNEIGGKLFNKLYAMLGNYEDAQDALQAGFLRCWRARSVLPGLRNMRAWVWRVSLNAGRDLRDNVWRRRAKPLSDVETNCLYRQASPTDELANQEEAEHLRAALLRLRPEEKEVFLLRQDRALTYGEIAQLRGTPVGTGKTLMRSAVHKLRQILQEDSRRPEGSRSNPLNRMKAQGNSKVTNI